VSRAFSDSTRRAGPGRAEEGQMAEKGDVRAKDVQAEMSQLEDSLRALRDRETASDNVNETSIVGIDNVLNALRTNITVVSWE
jgi:hypothetical protein